jgi:hypothetical protein
MPKGRGFDSRCYHWNFSLTCSFQPHCGPDVDSASNRNEYHEYFFGGKGGWCLGLQPSWAYYLEIWKSQPPETLRACPDLHRDCFSFIASSFVNFSILKTQRSKIFLIFNFLGFISCTTLQNSKFVFMKFYLSTE